MTEYTTYLERNEWAAQGISSNFTSVKCKTGVESKDNREFQEAKIDKRFVYAKSQTIQVLYFNNSDEAELDYPYLGPCGKIYTTQRPTLMSGPSVDIELLREAHREWCKKHPKLPKGIKLLSYTPEYKEEAGWYEYLTGPRTGQLWRHEPPLKKWKYKWVTNKVEIGIPTFSFTKGEALVKSSHPWTGVIQVEYYYDRAIDIKKKLKDNLTIEATYDFYLNPVGFDATGKEIDVFILPSEEGDYWAGEGRELWSELDCLICNPITSANADAVSPGEIEDLGGMVSNINNARITHSTECTNGCRTVCVIESLVKLAKKYAEVLKTVITENPLLLESSVWNPHCHYFKDADPAPDPFVIVVGPAPSESNSIEDRMRDYVKSEFKYADEAIYYKKFDEGIDPGEDTVKEMAFAYFMKMKKGLMLNGYYDGGGSALKKFVIWDVILGEEVFYWVYIIVLEMYGTGSPTPIPCETDQSTEANIKNTCQPKCLSDSCEWYQESVGSGKYTWLHKDIIMPCPVPWLCSLRAVALYTETSGFKVSIEPQWGIVRGFGDVEHANPYIDLNEVDATVSWQMSNTSHFMIPGEYFYFLYMVSFGEDAPCQYLHGPSGYFETHCLTSGIVLGCGYEDGSKGGLGTDYNENSYWIFNKKFRWLIEYKGKKLWVMPSDFAEYEIGDRVFIFKGGINLSDNTVDGNLGCRGYGMFGGTEMQISRNTVTYDLDDNYRILPVRLTGQI